MVSLPPTFLSRTKFIALVSAIILPIMILGPKGLGFSIIPKHMSISGFVLFIFIIFVSLYSFICFIVLPRLRDAALNPWFSSILLFPYGIILLVLALAIIPTRRKFTAVDCLRVGDVKKSSGKVSSTSRAVGMALCGIIGAIFIIVGMFLGVLGITFFLGIPFFGTGTMILAAVFRALNADLETLCIYCPNCRNEVVTPNRRLLRHLLGGVAHFNCENCKKSTLVLRVK